VIGQCLVPPVPAGAERAVRVWQTMSALREFGGAAGVVLAAAGLSAFELELVAAIESAVAKARRPAGEGERDGG
jgi:hypothetical protein